MGPPWNMWSPELYPEQIQNLAEQVAAGEISPLWVDQENPRQGLVLYLSSPWESDFFGFGCARCLGPFLVVEDQKDRQERGQQLARQVTAVARKQGHQLITIKTYHDPAVLRAFLAEDFTLAEIGAALAGPLTPENSSPEPLPCGFRFLSPPQIREKTREIVASLGDFFYDGHFRHDLLTDSDSETGIAQRLWSQVLEEDLNGAADPIVVLWDICQDRVAGVVTIRVTSREALLNILTVASPYRQRGLGRLIMLEALSHLADSSLRLRVETASYNLAALKLYQNLGLSPIAPLVALHHRTRASLSSG